MLRNTFSKPLDATSLQFFPDEERQRDRDDTIATTTNATTTASNSNNNDNDNNNNNNNTQNINHKEEDDDDFYALKCIAFDRISNEFIEELQNEIRILKNMDHPNIVKAYEVFYEYNHHKRQNQNNNNFRMLYVVMELCTGGDLYRRTPYSEKDAAKWITQLLSAVWYVVVIGLLWWWLLLFLIEYRFGCGLENGSDSIFGH